MKKVVILLFVALIIFTFSCTKSEEKKISLGSKSFTEGYVLGALAAHLLENAGFTVDRKPGMQTLIIREALTTGQIDGYMEYTGTAYSVFLKKTDIVNNPQTLFDIVKNEDLSKNGINWVAPIFSINNTYAMGVKKDRLQTYGTTLSSLTNYVNTSPETLRIAVNHEFYERPDGFPAMCNFYGMDINKLDVRKMDVGITYTALDNNDVDVAMVYSTDGLLKKYNLATLEDDRGFFPIYNPAFSVRKEVFEKYPEISDILAPLGKTLTNEDIVNLNYRVDAEGLDPYVVTGEYLKEKGLIK